MALAHAPALGPHAPFRRGSLCRLGGSFPHRTGAPWCCRERARLEGRWWLWPLVSPQAALRGLVRAQLLGSCAPRGWKEPTQERTYPL
ncbi:unnamed protein product, partial [Eretmochelys imbricata]